ncbi:MAG: alkaline phosphatase family protein [Planctomycetota bacterium]|nr:alkaline phosphatase family protein [Planctomycetota bacterium]
MDGAGSSYVQALIDAGQLPHFKKMQAEGAWTNNARCDYDISVTLPNHICQVTGRGVLGPAGHGWTSNGDPAAGQTLQSNKGSYVAGVFDVAHDNGLRTGLYTGKSKFALFDTSYNATHGEPDATGPDNGRDKIDEFVCEKSPKLVPALKAAMTGAAPFHYVLFHYAETDAAGHAFGWGSPAYNDAMKKMDAYLGQLFEMIAATPALKGKTAIILTADHGGAGRDHSDATKAIDYTIPFYVWGPGVQAGADLYALNPATLADPGTGRPDYQAAKQPVRNGDAANLALRLLGLGTVPGSTINGVRNVGAAAPATQPLPAAAALPPPRRRAA